MASAGIPLNIFGNSLGLYTTPLKVASAGGTIQKIFPSYKKKKRKKKRTNSNTCNCQGLSSGQLSIVSLYNILSLVILWICLSHQQYFYKASNLSLLLCSKNIV